MGIVFEKRCEALFEVAELPTLSLPDQSKIISEIIRDAAKHTRDAIFESDPLSNQSSVLRFSSISRAVYTGEERLAKTFVFCFPS